LKTKRGHIDWLVFLPVVALMLFSIAFVYSAGSYFSFVNNSNPNRLLMLHTAKVFFAILIMILVSQIDYHLWSKISLYILIIAIISLVVVLFVGGEVKGAKRWIDLGFLSFQPSELAKFAIIIHFGTLINRKKEGIEDFKFGYLPLLLWLILICLLIAFQPNLSMILVIFLTGMIILFLGNANLLHILATLFVGFIGAGIYAISAPYRLNRILFYLGLLEGSEQERLSYQVSNSLIALGSGGTIGLGPGGSHQNLLLSEPYTDFLFSIIGEEYGFIGLLLITAIFVFILWRGVRIAKHSKDLLGYLYAGGVVFSIFLVFAINSLVNSGLLPTTGVPLPFMSYGGTSIFFNAILIGILLNISTHKTSDNV
jgi:cell division protein FtsW